MTGRTPISEHAGAGLGRVFTERLYLVTEGSVQVAVSPYRKDEAERFELGERAAYAIKREQHGAEIVIAERAITALLLQNERIEQHRREPHTPIPDGKTGPWLREPHAKRDGAYVYDSRCRRCFWEARIAS